MPHVFLVCLRVGCRDWRAPDRSEEAVVTRVIEVSANRRVAVEWWGASEGFPLFLLHGTPGSRLGPVPRPGLLYRLGVRLISYDRPGYGKSDRYEGRDVAAA